MLPSIPLVLAFATAIAPVAFAQNTKTDPQLVGTWASKSKTVVTGPDFYDPVDEMMHEPRLPGISYSFTADGYYEEAAYIVLSNPTSPGCPTAMLQWQHGKYKIYNNGSLILTPIKVDGRQLYSDPCSNSKSIYTRYNQTETFKRYEILTDTGHQNQLRLNLYQFDGKPMNPMWIAYTPPQMLPTQTLNPLTASKTVTVGKATGAGKKLKLKRSLPVSVKAAEDIDPNRLWWIGVGMTTLGFVGYLFR
ncbi:chaperone for protein-folding within the ER, fungal-domain-containing protein [Geopyxis carbonaria]|nr:chaperone for protein-folding within the ER, fungal-domain-containing protein [Geopyxis carbonaria]